MKKPSCGFVFSCSFCCYKRHIIKYVLFFQPVSEWEDIWNTATADHSSRRKKYTIDTISFRDSEVIVTVAVPMKSRLINHRPVLLINYKEASIFTCQILLVFFICTTLSLFIFLQICLCAFYHFSLLPAYALQWLKHVSSVIFLFSPKTMLTLPVKVWLPFFLHAVLGYDLIHTWEVSFTLSITRTLK